MTTKSTKRPKLFPLFTTPALKFKFAIRFTHSSKQKSPLRTCSPKPASPTQAPELSPGTVLGRGFEYTLVRPLGNGGFSTVWLAQTDSKEDDVDVDDGASFHTALTYLSPPASNLVAIKVLTTAGERTRELSKHLRLDHPPDQLVKLLDHFTFGERQRSRRVSLSAALPVRPHPCPISVDMSCTFPSRSNSQRSQTAPWQSLATVTHRETHHKRRLGCTRLSSFPTPHSHRRPATKYPPVPTRCPLSRPIRVEIRPSRPRPRPSSFLTNATLHRTFSHMPFAHPKLFWV